MVVHNGMPFSISSVLLRIYNFNFNLQFKKMFIHLSYAYMQRIGPGTLCVLNKVLEQVLEKARK